MPNASHPRAVKIDLRLILFQSLWYDLRIEMIQVVHLRDIWKGLASHSICLTAFDTIGTPLQSPTNLTTQF